MSSCDYIRDNRKQQQNDPSKNSPINRILLRNGSHHKSHEILTDYKGSDKVQSSSPAKCDLIRATTNSIDRKDKNKRNSRSEDNLLGIAQRAINPSPSGQILLTQDFFTVSELKKRVKGARVVIEPFEIIREECYNVFKKGFHVNR